MTGGYDLSNDYDGGKELAKFIRSCINNGLNADYVRHFLDYMLMTDFIITNSDRHWYNFGILRDTETLRFVSMAPIYDNGNSMFYNIYSPLNRASLLHLEDNGIIKQEVKRLDLVQDRNIINTSLLPTPSQVEEYYLNHAIDKERVNIITRSYSNKLDLFMEYQLGLPISYNTEMYDYISEVPVVNQQINSAFFEERPQMMNEAIKNIISLKHYQNN